MQLLWNALEDSLFGAAKPMLRSNPSPSQHWHGWKDSGCECFDAMSNGGYYLVVSDCSWASRSYEVPMWLSVKSSPNKTV